MRFLTGMVKCELELACFCPGKMGFKSVGLELGHRMGKLSKIGMGSIFCNHDRLTHY